MSKQIVPILFLVLALLATAWTMPIQRVQAIHVTRTTLFADFNAFNFTKPSGSNPTIIVLSNATLLVGNPRLPPRFTVALQWVNSLHDFAIFNSADVRLDLTDFVDSSHVAASKSFTLPTGVYSYRCEIHPAAMRGILKAINPDVDLDGDVDIDDLIGVFQHQFGADLRYDVDLDGDVDIDDLIIVFTHQFI